MGTMTGLHESVREEPFNYVKNVGNTYNFFHKTEVRMEIKYKSSALFEVIIQLKTKLNSVDMKIFKKLHLILISCVVLHSLV
jgi:hypothetical protein